MDVIKIHCITCPSIRYSFFFSLSQNIEANKKLRARGNADRGPGRAEQCELRREQMCRRAEGGGLGKDQLLQEVSLEPGPEGSN